MGWLEEGDHGADRDVPLAGLTWFGLGGRARWLAHPADPADLGRLLQQALASGIPVKILGGGANVLVRDDGFDGIVVRLDQGAFRRVVFDGERVHAGAGADLMPLVRDCCRRGLAGLEGLAGIPGTVGGALHMNAGGRFGDISRCVETVDVIDTDGQPRQLSPAEVGFAYRRTNLGGRTVTGTTLRLSRDHPNTVYARFREYWRIKKEAQPLADHSAGCVFTNPPGDSAGRLIDSAGLKGTRCGGARVSDRHANFIVADEGATATDVLRLIERIRQTVRRQHGTELELEIDVW